MLLENIESVFKRVAKSKASKLISLYEENPSLNFKEFVVSAIISILVANNRTYYATESMIEVWSATIPDKLGSVNIDDSIQAYDYKKLRRVLDNQIVYFFCYLLSVFDIDEYFRTSDKVKGWLPLYNGDKPVTFIEKALNLLPYSKFVEAKEDRIRDIFLQLRTLGMAIHADTLSAESLADMTNSLISIITISAKAKAFDAMSLIPENPKDWVL